MPICDSHSYLKHEQEIHKKIEKISEFFGFSAFFLHLNHHVITCIAIGHSYITLELMQLQPKILSIYAVVFQNG